MADHSIDSTALNASLPDVFISLEQYKDIVLSVSDAIVITEADIMDAPGPKIIFVNDAFSKMTGYSADEALGRSPRFLQGKATSQSELQRLKDALKKQEPIRGELINYRKDGSEYLIELEIVPLFNSDKQVTHLVSVQRDITARRKEDSILKASETFNRTVLESSPDCLKVLDNHGRLQYMNFNGLCQMEIDDFGTLKNNYWWDLWGEENATLVKASVDKALTGEIAQFSAFCNTAKGTPKWWDVTVSPVSNDNGVYQILSVSRDITEQKNAEAEIFKLNNSLEAKVKARTEELLAKNAELERSNAELASFNYIASHDLQEPLRKIDFFTNLIAHEESAEKKAHYFDRILAANKRMQNLIKSLKAFSKVNHFSVALERCDLNVILSDTLSYLNENIKEKKAVIETVPLPVIDGERVLLSQLFINLIENALKYSKADTPPVISFTTALVDSTSFLKNQHKPYTAYYQIRISDNGIGFSDDYKDKIFEIFQRLHDKNEFEGTGIGLAICKKIIIQHNGFIEAEGEPGHGSTFILYFPKPFLEV